MKIARGYHAMTVMSDGSVFALGGSWGSPGGNKDGEVWSPRDKRWHTKRGIDVDAFLTKARADYHMWLFQAPNGKLFHAGPSRQMHWITTGGNGGFMKSVTRGDRDQMNGNAVMYDIGKIITMGGAPRYNDSPPTRNCHIIDLNGREATVRRTGDMTVSRGMMNSVVLPSGDVVTFGGQTGSQKAFSDANSVFHAEIWSPKTGRWKRDQSMRVPRNYHSVALLLKDGRVVTAGGGLCNGCRVNHPDAEIFTPPYLLNEDGSAARRPRMSGEPSRIKPGQRFTVRMDTVGSHTFSLMRTGAATHSVNNDQRRVPLRVVQQSGVRVTLEVPNNKNVVIPGTYFLFAMNKAGTPSDGATVSYNPGVH